MQYLYGTVTGSESGNNYSSCSTKGVFRTLALSHHGFPVDQPDDCVLHPDETDLATLYKESSTKRVRIIIDTCIEISHVR